MELLGGSNIEPARSLFWLHPAVQLVYTERTDIPVHMNIDLNFTNQFPREYAGATMHFMFWGFKIQSNKKIDPIKWNCSLVFL